MADIVGDIAIQVGANIGPLVRDMGKAKGAVSGFGNTTASHTATLRAFTIAGAAMAAATVAAGTAMAALTKHSLDSIDAMSKSAKALGISTANLQAMSMVAQEAGVETAAFTTALTKMQDSIVSLGQGMASQEIAFKRLGLTFSDIASLGADEQFRLIAEGIESIASPAERTATAMDIFGRSGAAVVNMVNGYASALDNARGHQDRFNIAVSDFDAAQVEAANDAVGRLKSASEGLGNTLATITAPGIKAAADALAGYIANLNAAVEATRALGAEGLTSGAVEKDLFNTALANGDIGALGPPGSNWGLTAGGLFPNDLGAPFTADPNAPRTRPRQRGVDSFAEIGGGSTGGGGGGSLQSELDRMREGFATEQELVAQQYEERLAKLREFREAKQLTEEEFNELEASAKQEQEDRLAEIERAAQATRLQAFAGAFGDLASLMQTSNDKLFKIGQGAAIAEGLVNGWSAAVAAWDKGMKIGGPPVATAFAAASLAKTGALISNIASQSSRGSGSGGGGSGGGGAAGVGAASQPSTYVNVQLVGENFGKAQFSGLVSAINQEIEDGAVIKGIRAV